MLRNTRNILQIAVLFFLLNAFWACQTSENKKTTQKISKVDMSKLLGKWVSVHNEKNVIELTQTRMISYSNGLKLSDESLKVYNNCIARCLSKDKPIMPCLVTDGKRAENCFEILTLTDTKLSYALVGQSKKIMEFKKLQ